MKIYWIFSGSWSATSLSCKLDAKITHHQINMGLAVTFCITTISMLFLFFDNLSLGRKRSLSHRTTRWMLFPASQEIVWNSIFIFSNYFDFFYILCTCQLSFLQCMIWLLNINDFCLDIKWFSEVLSALKTQCQKQLWIRGSCVFVEIAS